MPQGMDHFRILYNLVREDQASHAKVDDELFARFMEERKLAGGSREHTNPWGSAVNASGVEKLPHYAIMGV